MQPARPLTCASCGYDLSATPVVRNQITCPECGGHRVRMTRWWEPRCSRAAGAGLAGLALLGAAPTLAAVWLLAPEGSTPARLVGAAPPFLALAGLLAAWRPARTVGVVVAGSASFAALMVVLYGLTFGFVCMPLGLAAVALYYVVPIPVGVLLARTAFRP